MQVHEQVWRGIFREFVRAITARPGRIDLAWTMQAKEFNGTEAVRARQKEGGMG